MTKATKTKVCAKCEIMYVPVMSDQPFCWNCSDDFIMSPVGDVISETVADDSTMLYLIASDVYSYIKDKFNPANYNPN